MNERRRSKSLLYLFLAFSVMACATVDDVKQGSQALRGSQEASAPGNIALDVTTYLGDHQIFVEGDAIYYLVSMDRDAYLVLVHEDAESNVIQIYPNAAFGREFHYAGSYFQVPDPILDGRLVVSSPFGLETLWAFASTKPFPEISRDVSASGLVDLGRSIQRVRDIFYKHAVHVGGDFGEASVVVKTVERKR